MQSRPQPCHNCRRQRLKCDRSLPQCHKCIKRGQECLGYQRLFRWGQGVASRGKMAGLTFGEMKKDEGKTENPEWQRLPQISCRNTQTSPLQTPTDPFIQDLNPACRRYLYYFTNHVCRDLVLYDVPKHNPFRELIPLTSRHPVLLQIIIANSALHMSNASQKSLVLDTPSFPLNHRSSAIQQPESYQDALVAKQRALSLLKAALANIASVDVDVTLAVVLLFIEFELIDSGRDGWRHHINGARAIIQTFCGSTKSTQSVMNPLRTCLISHCLVFDIFGSTLTHSAGLIPSDVSSAGALSLLQDAEGNHCSSFPATLLHLIQIGAQLTQPTHPLYPSISSKQHQSLLLLYNARSFNPLTWATNLRSCSPTTDILHRTHIASAHRAAVCIYLSRVVLSLDPFTQLPHTFESLEADIITHLSFINPRNTLFTATTWPTFILGAETNDCVMQEWVARRFQELWEIEPWGLLRSAFGVLQKIWLKNKRRSGMEKNGVVVEGHGDWIRDLKEEGIDWLII